MIKRNGMSGSDTIGKGLAMLAGLIALQLVFWGGLFFIALSLLKWFGVIG